MHPALVEQTARLCKHIGYYGVFELEFIILDQKAMLIDFNGRFYHQLAFDMGRGIDLPLLVYAAALEDHARVHDLMAQSKAEDRERAAGFCDRFRLATRINMQRMFGKMPAKKSNGGAPGQRAQKAKSLMLWRIPTIPCHCSLTSPSSSPMLRVIPAPS